MRYTPILKMAILGCTNTLELSLVTHGERAVAVGQVTLGALLVATSVRHHNDDIATGVGAGAHDRGIEFLARSKFEVGA